ncbi:MAG: tRNA pseudouridine(38-40) synthase TruA [Ruminococcus sp.]|nr:tRNA pseudouridine(38-40) synthase TruA [Ruminococcus sp.]
MRNLKVTMAFRGTNYHGYQRQNNALTVQEVVEDAVSKILNTKTTIYGCSRTDTGVHAEKFCFSFKTENQIPIRNFIRGINGYLPKDISVLDCEEMPEDFHARFSCVGKTYLYRIHNSESKDPFSTDMALHYRRPIDIELMKKAAEFFVGTHDFGSFCADCSKKLDTIRTIYQFQIEINENDIKILVKGNGFLYNMVRILVGTLLDINEGRIKLSDLESIMNARDRRLAGRTALPHGLYLHEVYYDSI